MNREYHKWWSRRLDRDMELLVFGHSGVPIVVFPSSQGRFFEFEDRGMIGAVAHKIDAGEIQTVIASTASTPRAGTTAMFRRAGASRATFSTRTT